MTNSKCNNWECKLEIDRLNATLKEKIAEINDLVRYIKTVEDEYWEAKKEINLLKERNDKFMLKLNTELKEKCDSYKAEIKSLKAEVKFLSRENKLIREVIYDIR